MESSWAVDARSGFSVKGLSEEMVRRLHGARPRSTNEAVNESSRQTRVLIG